MGDIPHAELAGERLEDLACDAGLLRLDDLQCFRRTSCCRAPCAPNARSQRPRGEQGEPAVRCTAMLDASSQSLSGQGNRAVEREPDTRDVRHHEDRQRLP